jgi:hypothetical protein
MFTQQQSGAKQQQEKHNYAKLEESYKLMQVDIESACGQTIASVLMMEGENVQVHKASANGHSADAADDMPACAGHNATGKLTS